MRPLASQSSIFWPLFLVFDGFVFQRALNWEQPLKPENGLLVCELIPMSARQVQVNDWIVDRSKQLGSGTYGHVFACACRTNFCKRGAIKVIPKKNLQPNAKRLLDREVEVLKEVEGHPNIVRLFEAFETEAERYIVMERISGQDLFEVIRLNGAIKEATARILLEPLFTAISHLHSMGIIHRDIKLENVMIPSWAIAGGYFREGLVTPPSTSPRGVRQEADARRFLRHVASNNVKLIDFGMAGHVNLTNPDARLTEWCGSLSSASVELVGRIPYRFEVDIWALGVLLFTVVAGFKPFDGDSPDALCRKIMSEPVVFPPWFSNSLCDLIGGMMSRRASTRLSIEGVRTHPWATVHEEASLVQLPRNEIENLRASPLHS